MSLIRPKLWLLRAYLIDILTSDPSPTWNRNGCRSIYNSRFCGRRFTIQYTWSIGNGRLRVPKKLYVVLISSADASQCWQMWVAFGLFLGFSANLAVNNTGKLAWRSVLTTVGCVWNILGVFCQFGRLQYWKTCLAFSAGR